MRATAGMLLVAILTLVGCGSMTLDTGTSETRIETVIPNAKLYKPIQPESKWFRLVRSPSTDAYELYIFESDSSDPSINQAIPLEVIDVYPSSEMPTSLLPSNARSIGVRYYGPGPWVSASLIFSN